MSTRSIIAFAWSLGSLLGCDGGGGGASPPAPPVFPADWETAYTPVRSCQRSGDHDLNYVRILAAPDALETYQKRQAPFAVGAVLLKSEYEDDQCSKLLGFTAMVKEKAGYDPEAGDWRWQKATAGRVVTEDGQLPKCRSCHMAEACHPEAPGLDTGFDFTCGWPEL